MTCFVFFALSVPCAVAALKHLIFLWLLVFFVANNHLLEVKKTQIYEIDNPKLIM
jgi:hypothetical protein